MDREQIENIYHTLIGVINEEYRVPGVENLLAVGGACDRAYEQMLDAIKMFEYGRKL